MPRNVDALALFFIVAIVLTTGYFVDHGPVCVTRHMRVGVINQHEFVVVAPQAPKPPSPPTMPEMPQLPRF
jgi:hypothetical protein